MTADQIPSVEFPEPDPKVTPINSRQERVRRVLKPVPKVGIRGMILQRELYDYVSERVLIENKPAGEITGGAIQLEARLLRAATSGLTISLVSPDGRTQEIVYRLPPENVVPLKRK